MATPTEVVRRFNRSYTQRIGALDERFLGLARPLGPSRLLWEIGAAGSSVAELRDRLGLDSGYVSRLLRRLEGEGLVVTEPDPDDGRRRVVRLTEGGRREWDELDRRSNDRATELLARLDVPRQEELAEALATADRLLRAATVAFEVVDPRSDEALVSMTAYFAELDVRFTDGFDPGDTLVAGAADMRPPGGAFVVARSDGEAIACGGVLDLGDGVSEIKRMWVSSAWRGLGLGRRMLDELEAQARALGYTAVQLDTNGVLTEAITMYESAGYEPTGRYNDNPYAQRWFVKRLD